MSRDDVHKCYKKFMPEGKKNEQIVKMRLKSAGLAHYTAQSLY